jgi:uncharacterized DUF497 family protein
MKIAYDEAKRTSNLNKHGFDFADLDMAFFEGSVIVPGKVGRWMAIGEFADTIIAVVFAPLGAEAVSIISMRHASRKERKVL